MDENENQYLEDMLEDAIGENIEKFKTLEPGTEEYAATARAICELYKICIEYTKTGMEYRDKETNRMSEENFRAQQLELQKKFNYLELGKDLLLGLLSIGLPLAFYGSWMKKGLEFEETGSFTSTTMKNLIRLFKPTKI